MKCPSCGARSLSFMGGENRLCLSCGYGGSYLMELVAEQEPNIRPSNQPNPSVEPLSRLTTSVNRFGFRLLSALSNHEPGRNLLISPPGLFSALALLARGAAGDTAQSLLRGLDLTESDLALAAAEASSMLRRISHPGPENQGDTLALSTALFGRKGLSFRPEFMEAARAAAIEIHPLSPMEEAAGSRMSTWLRDHAQARSTLNPGPLDSLAILFALQTAAFRASWPAAAPTPPLLFQLPDGLRKKIQPLQAAGWFHYLEGDHFQLAGLPCQSPAGQLTLYLVLPDQQSGLEELQKLLAAKRWEGWLAKARLTRGEITLPKFHSEYATILNTSLEDLNLGVIFDELRANFEGMCPIPPMPDVYLSGVWSQASFSAQAESSPSAGHPVSLRDLLDAVQTPFTMQAARPFFFALREADTGLLVLMGLLNDPR